MQVTQCSTAEKSRNVIGLNIQLRWAENNVITQNFGGEMTRKAL
jgi:hypothetical protein